MLKVDATGDRVVSHAGSVLLTRTADVVGLGDALSAALAPWRKPHAVHDPGKIVLDLAVAVAIGGDCLADIATIRAEPGVFGLVASDPTVSRLVDTLAADVDKALAAINTARAAGPVQGVEVGRVGTRPTTTSTADRPLVIDLDATLVTAHSREGAGGTELQARLRVSPAGCVGRPRPGRHR